MYLHSMNTYIYLKYIFAFFYRFKSTDKPLFKILNGTCAPYGSVPWIVQIQAEKTVNRYSHHCGGTILTDDMILTAAHCI